MSVQAASLGEVIPWQQFVNPVGFVIGYTAEGICEPGLGIDAIELGGLNQSIAMSVFTI